MTNSAMCHFETYVKGTTENHRYYKEQVPPSKLLNPTKYLLKLAAKGLSKLNPVATNPLSALVIPLPDSGFSGMGLLMFHNAFPSGVRWGVSQTRQGIEVEGQGLNVTQGFRLPLPKFGRTTATASILGPNITKCLAL